MSVAVLVSGGVDSSVALRLLREHGHTELTAFYIKIWLEDELAFLGRCPWQEDLELLRQVCDQTRVELAIVSLQRDYFDTVVASVVDGLRSGSTPSPDVLCNRSIKFGAFLDRVVPAFDAVASGHYARVQERAGVYTLHRGVDPVKDQSYFLCLLDQRRLARSIFPVGGLTKTEVRELARGYQLPNAERPDSQGVCFLGRIPYDEFIRFHLGERRGEIRELGSGRLLGEHSGYWFFTIGQRRGLGLAGGPWYVVSKEVEDNVVWVCRAGDLAAASRRTVRVPEPHWIAGPPSSRRLDVRVRHGERLLGCEVEVASDGTLEITLDQPDPGLATGQFAVLYDGDCCLGGGAMWVC